MRRSTGIRSLCKKCQPQLMMACDITPGSSRQHAIMPEDLVGPAAFAEMTGGCCKRFMQLIHAIHPGKGGVRTECKNAALPAAYIWIGGDLAEK